MTHSPLGAPVKKYRVGVIGSTGRGDYGHGLDEVWRDVPSAEVVAVADDNKMGLAAATKKLGVPAGYADYRKMLDEAKPEIVAIGLRWLDRHQEMIVAAAERGIHIFVEKPLCRTPAEADAIVAACERTHAKLVIAYQSRYSPKLAVVRQLIADGKIGGVLEYRGRGKEDARGGAEDLWVLGSHIVDLIRALSGDATSCFASVAAGGKPITKADVVDGNEGLGPLAGDSIAAMYTMADGTRAYFASQRNAAGRPSRFGVQIFGTHGIIDMATNYLPNVKLLPDAGWSPGRTKRTWQDVSSAGLGKPEPIKQGHPHWGNVAAAKDLIASIEENRQPAASVYNARAAVEMVLAVFASARQGTAVALPLKNRQHPLDGWT